MRRVALATLALFASTACTAADAGTADGGGAAAAAAADAVAYAPTDAEEAEVVAALQSVFDALRSGDADLLRDVMDPGVVMHFSERNAAGEASFGSSTVEGLATRIASSEVPLIERMWDPVVRVDGALATIWTPYDFYVGDQFSHCGVDSATLMNGEDGWRVVGLSWTRHQPPTCPLHPDGPPQE